MTESDYLMESDKEIRRLECKTPRLLIKEQALWAGLKPGDRVADIGCGPGKTTMDLHEIVGSSGTAIGIDASEKRIEHAQRQYGRPGLEFVCRDFCQPLDDLGTFDFIWIRFVLEYYRTNSLDILKRFAERLRPGGCLCLLDIDQSCMCHYGLPKRLSLTVEAIIETMEQEYNFDRNAGRKLYSYLFDLGFSNIEVRLDADHMIYGDLDEVNAFNLQSKIEIGAKLLEPQISETYSGGSEEFLAEFDRAISDPRRFIYAPLIVCRGSKPSSI